MLLRDEIFHKDCIGRLGLGPVGGSAFTVRKQQRYSVGASGAVEWLQSRSIHTYYLSDKVAFSNYLSFETCEVASGVAAFGSSKGTVVKAK
eukprot:5929783-Pleurochrysis_carterae.AAC.1